MVGRKAETFEPVTMRHIRGQGCRDLLIYCDSGRCHHSATMNADWLWEAAFTTIPAWPHSIARSHRKGRSAARSGGSRLRASNDSRRLGISQPREQSFRARVLG
jgi:hypothetical protein